MSKDVGSIDDELLETELMDGLEEMLTALEVVCTEPEEPPHA
mgnify:FL=1